MDLSQIAIGTLEQIQEFSHAIATNIVSQILASMASEKNQTTYAPFEPELRQEITNCVIACLKGESDKESRLLLVRCIFDDVTVKTIAELFIWRQYDEARIVESAKSRLPVDVDWAFAEPLIIRATKDLVERFRYAVARNQVLFNRLSMAGWEREEKQASEVRRTLQTLVKEFESIQKSVADFPNSENLGANENTAISKKSSILASAGDFPENSNAAVAFLKDDFESALYELKLGSAKKAKSGFATVVDRLEKLGTAIDRNLYFRAKCNLGISAYAAGESKDFAADCLEAALPYADGSIKGRINLALARSLKDKEEEAITILSAVLFEESENFDALLHRSGSYARLNRREDALADLQRAKPQSKEDQMNLASAFLAINANEEAASISKQILSEYPDDPWAKIILSSATCLPIVEKINEQKIGSGFRSRDDMETIARGTTLLEEVLPWIRTSDRSDRYYEVLSNLSAYHSIQGNYSIALRYADEAIAHLDCGESLYRNRFIAALLTKEYKKALESAQALQAFAPLQESIVRQIEALKGLGRFREGLDLVEEVRKKADEDPLSTYLRVLEIDLVLGLPDLERADSLVKNLNKDFPKDSIAWLTAAELAKIKSNAEEEEECLRKAVEFADTPGLKLQCRGMLGQFLGQSVRWREALEMMLPEDADQNFETPYIVEIAICYFNLGRPLESLKLCERRLEKKYNSNACHLAIQCCLAMVELEKARQFAELMHREDSANQVEAWGFLAHLEYRLNRPEQARKILVSAITKEASSHLLLLLSSICKHLGRHEEAVKYAVRALSVSEENDQIRCHRAIVDVSFALPETIKLEDTVRRQVQKSVKLLAKESDSGVTALPTEPDFAALKNMLRAQQRAASEGQRMFMEDGFPICVLTYMSGKDLDVVWHGLIQGNGLRANMASGTQEEQSFQLESAANCRGVVLDATALLTFRHLGLLDKLPLIFGKVLVAFPVYEQFLDFLNEAKHGPSASGWITLVNDKLNIQQFIPGSYEAARVEFVAPIVTFIETLERIGFEEPIDINEAGSFLKECDPILWASVQVARSSGFPLLCDDIGTLQAAHLACEVSGFCSQAALRIGHERKIVTDLQYAESAVQLFESHYHFVSEDMDSLITYLEKHQWLLTSGIRGIFERFDSGSVSPLMACRIMGGVLAHAWLRAKGSDSDIWMDYICERLRSAGNPTENFITAMLGAMETYSDAPDLFVGFTNSLFKAGRLPNDAATNIRTAARTIKRIYRSNLYRHTGKS